MQYVRLGRSGLKVSRFSLGMMTYGTPAWRPWVLDEATARPLVRAAVEAGINCFDTADMYSAGVSEELTGKFVRDWMQECAVGQPMFKATRRINDDHQIEKVGEKLRDMMPWIKKGKMVDKARN